MSCKCLLKHGLGLGEPYTPNRSVTALVAQRGLDFLVSSLAFGYLVLTLSKILLATVSSPPIPVLKNVNVSERIGYRLMLRKIETRLFLPSPSPNHVLEAARYLCTIPVPVAVV